jgi:hypothetical protein
MKSQLYPANAPFFICGIVGFIGSRHLKIEQWPQFWAESALLFVYCIFASAVGYRAIARGRSGMAWSLFATFATPIVAGLALFAFPSVAITKPNTALTA